MKSGKLIVLSAPSGTGKGTVVSRLMQMRGDLDLSISWTTRAPRPGDQEGVTYFFKTEDEFEALVRVGGFIEYAGVYGRRYGTPRDYVRARQAMGRHVLLEIDTQGALQVLANEPGAVSVFLLPPSMAELRRRLTGRGTETAEKAAQRFAFAYEELTRAENYDYCIINDDVDVAAQRFSAIIDAENQRTALYEDHIRALKEEKL